MTNRKELLREFLLMNLGTLLVSVGVYFFKFPNHFSMGGVSGLAVLLGKLLPQLSPSTFNTIINVLFLVLGFVMLNRGFGARTVYCSILSAGLIQLFEWAFPMDRPLTDQLMLELFFAVILPALGSAILFNIDASSGGTDIAAMILKKYTGLDVGRALLLSDVVIAAAALFVFDITADCAPCWAWPSSRCWWIAPSSPSTGARPFSSSPTTRSMCATILPIPWAGAPPYGRPRALIPTQSTTWCSPSSPGGRPCFCAAT